MNWKRVFSQRWDSKGTLLAGLLASSVLLSMASAQAAPQNAAQQKPPASAQSKPSSANGPSRRLAKVGIPASARQYYQLTFGVDNLSIKSVESGSMLRFSYHVLNAAKAQALNDKKATLSLRPEKPSTARGPVYGKGRTVTPEFLRFRKVARTGWSSRTSKDLVKPGARVDVVIGPFRAQGLLVE